MPQTTLRGFTSPESETPLSSWPTGRAPPLWEGCEQGTFRWRAQSHDRSQRQWPLQRTQGPQKQGTGLTLSKEVTAKLLLLCKARSLQRDQESSVVQLFLRTGTGQGTPRRGARCRGAGNPLSSCASFLYFPTRYHSSPCTMFTNSKDIGPRW